MGDYPLGYAGTLLRVNLTDKKVVRQKLDREILSRFIGGRGINVKFLYDEVGPDTDPLGPQNKIIFGIGPCAGTTVPGGQRYNITAKSPLTGFIGDSNSGGDFGAALKYAGYDMIILEGRSDSPVYLFVDDDRVELKPAGHLWGKTTFETRRTIEREVHDPRVSVASIGPAGENLVRFSCVITDIGRAAGRCGMGAVLGSKNVKAVAVKGTRGVRVADYKMLKELNRENEQLWRADPDVYKAWTEYGPTKGWRAYAVCGMLPTKNFQEGVFEKNLFEEMLEKQYLVKQKSCMGCPLGCNHSFVIRSGPYAGTMGEGVELTQLGDFGPRVGNDDLALALKADTLCDEYGVDIMDMSGVIAYAMECYGKGILTPGDVNGMKLDWGNAGAILAFIEMVVHRKGLGDILAEGLSRAAATIGQGSEKYTMQVKGQALVMRDVRASKAWALMYAVSSRGACHMRAWVPEGYGAGGTMAPGIYDQALLKLVEHYRDPLNQQIEEGKAEMVKWCEDLRALRDTLNVCHFPLYRLCVDAKNKSSAELYTRYLNAVTGSDLSGTDGLFIGERICNLERAFNIRAGLSRKDDTLPDRMLKEPMPNGPSKGQVVDLEPMLDRYYELRGWDKGSGIPTREKLLDMGLAHVADDLASS